MRDRREPPGAPGTINLDTGRLKKLLIERNTLELRHVRADAEVGRLTQEQNVLVGRSNATTDRLQRAKLDAEYKKRTKDVDKSRAEREKILKEFHRKELEIADVVAALWEAAQAFIAASTRSAAHSDSAAADELVRLAATLHAVEGATTKNTSAIATAEAAARSAAEGVERLSRSVHDIERGLSGQPPPGRRRILQIGGRPDVPATPELSEEEKATLPENTTVLLFASEPRDLPRPDLAQEITEILRRIDEAEFGDRIDLRPWPATQPFDLLPNLNRHKPHMVQFSGHGREDGILLMGPNDRSEPIEADQLIQMLRWTNVNLRIVFFNLCDSEAHARLAAEFVDAAIGLRGAFSDAPAREFAAALYSALAFGKSVEHAFHQACAKVQGWPDGASPQLFFREDADPSRIVLVKP